MHLVKNGVSKEEVPEMGPESQIQGLQVKSLAKDFRGQRGKEITETKPDSSAPVCLCFQIARSPLTVAQL